ncbi:MAG: hypothetical protein HY901_22260 [Deltaproteobacteria bacterium]|nr:hypothetical protein [Deltaproteobacteria bacterium]
MGIEKVNHSLEKVEKLRGQENAALQHSKRQPLLREEKPAVSVSVGDQAADAQEPTYEAAARSAAIAAARERALAATKDPPPEGTNGVSGDSRFKVNAHVGEVMGGATGGATLLLGDGASMKVNLHARAMEPSAAGGTLVLGEGASLKANIHADSIEGGGGTIVLAAGASLTLNVHAARLAGGDTLEVAAGESLKIDVREQASAPARQAQAIVSRTPIVALEPPSIRLSEPLTADGKQETNAGKHLGQVVETPFEERPRAERMLSSRDYRYLLMMRLFQGIDHQQGEKPGIESASRAVRVRAEPQGEVAAVPELEKRSR